MKEFMRAFFVFDIDILKVLEHLFGVLARTVRALPGSIRALARLCVERSTASVDVSRNSVKFTRPAASGTGPYRIRLLGRAVTSGICPNVRSL